MLMVPRVGPNGMKEIPVTRNNISLFVDPISHMIKSAAFLAWCNEIAPPG
jgi:hypothetical protein